jgi:hypothetical protein
MLPTTGIIRGMELMQIIRQEWVLANIREINPRHCPPGLNPVHPAKTSSVV